jgi:hypothetical protein
LKLYFTNYQLQQIRTIHNKMEYQSETQMNNNIEERENARMLEDIQLNIFRHKFSEEFMVDLSIFSKIHQYDDRETFKEAWKIWAEENEEMIGKEMEVLSENNYTGDVLDKMFKSARYYFRKKSTEKREPKERRKYIHVNDELLKTMDDHIISKIKDPKYQPKYGFENFCKENYEVLKKSVQTICLKGVTDSELIQEKIKKTYKNRYFILVNNRKNQNL